MTLTELIAKLTTLNEEYKRQDSYRGIDIEVYVDGVDIDEVSLEQDDTGSYIDILWSN